MSDFYLFFLIFIQFSSFFSCDSYHWGITNRLITSNGNNLFRISIVNVVPKNSVRASRTVFPLFDEQQKKRMRRTSATFRKETYAEVMNCKTVHSSNAWVNERKRTFVSVCAAYLIWDQSNWFCHHPYKLKCIRGRAALASNPSNRITFKYAIKSYTHS